MNENRKAAIYHRVAESTYQDSDFMQLHHAFFLAKHKGYDVVAVQPDVKVEPVDTAWQALRTDFKGGRFDALIVSGVSGEPILYEQVPEEPDDALDCLVADKPLPEPPCGLERPCPVHDGENIT